MLPTLKKRSQFINVKKLGMSWTSESFILQGVQHAPGTPSSYPSSRIGFVATKKLGGAVVRNRAKRRLREACRLSSDAFYDAGFDYVLICRSASLSASFEKILHDISWATRHLHRQLGTRKHGEKTSDGSSG